MLDRVTLGITCFNRPHLVRRLLASIDEHCPGVRIDIAENGLTGFWDTTIQAWEDGRRIFLLPFDAGCSAARNELARRFVGDYLLFLEEDFVFTARTKLEPLIQILDGDSTVGVAGGYVDPGNRPAPIEKRSIDGLDYYTAKTLRMFVLCRRECLQDHRFQELMKTGEHGVWTSEIHDAGKWKMAFTNATSISHEPDAGNQEYKAFRGRAKQFREDWATLQRVLGYLRLHKDKKSRSLFGKLAANSFGHGDLLFLDFVLCKHPEWKHCIELGTGSGLTTLYLGMCFQLRGGTVWTYDNRKQRGRMFHEHFGENVIFEETDVLSEPLPQIVGQVSHPDRFVLFDNGCKREEVAMYAEHLKPGAGFIVHDWPREFGPEDLPAILAMGFEEKYTAKAEMLQSCCRCFVRTG